MIKNKQFKKKNEKSLVLQPRESNYSLAIQKLIELIKSKNSNERRLAASSLGKLAKYKPQIYKACPYLIRLLKDDKPQVRQYAAKALGKIGYVKALPYLKELLNDEKYYVRKAAKNAIKIMNNINTNSRLYINCEIEKDVIESARRIYKILGSGHEEAIYREAMSIELQDKGYVVKTEMPITIKYKTSSGREMIVGSARVDLYIEKKEKKAILELKTTTSLIEKENREKLKGYKQLQKYISALGKNIGFLVNFPFPPKEEPEIISTFEER